MANEKQGMVANPFAAPTQAKGAMTDAAVAREVTEVQAGMVIAKRFPRDAHRAMEGILQACCRPALAEGAVYQYARGGTDITGPSIRLAEVLAQGWGNFDFGIRELEQRAGESTVEAFAWDLETNTRQRKVFQVPHTRHTKSGTYRLTDPRDIYEMVANQGARRLRACILGVIPGDVQEAALRQCELTMAAHASVDAESVGRMVAAFAELGVSREQIEARIQRKAEAMTSALMVNLRKIYASLRDGMSAPEEWFPPMAEAAVSDPAAGAEAKPRSAQVRERMRAPKADKPAPKAAKGGQGAAGRSQDKPAEASPGRKASAPEDGSQTDLGLAGGKGEEDVFAPLIDQLFDDMAALVEDGGLSPEQQGVELARIEGLAATLSDAEERNAVTAELARVRERIVAAAPQTGGKGRR